MDDAVEELLVDKQLSWSWRFKRKRGEYLTIETGAGAVKGDGGAVIKAMEMTNETSPCHAKRPRVMFFRGVWENVTNETSPMSPW